MSKTPHLLLTRPRSLSAESRARYRGAFAMERSIRDANAIQRMQGIYKGKSGILRRFTAISYDAADWRQLLRPLQPDHDVHTRCLRLESSESPASGVKYPDVTNGLKTPTELRAPPQSSRRAGRCLRTCFEASGRRVVSLTSLSSARHEGLAFKRDWAVSATPVASGACARHPSVIGC
jgi:hypothetical protein